MSDRIKGITIRFDGDTRGLTRAINNVRKESGDLSRELRAIDRELKFNPRNINLLAQKQQVLTNRVKASVTELEHLKAEQKRLAADPSIDKNSAEWRKLEREIIRAERQTRAAAREMVKFGGSAKMNAISSGLTDVGRKLTNVTKGARRAAGAIAGIALYKGFERLKSLDETSTQLQTLGYRGKQLEGIMEGVKKSVSGTRFTLQDMAKVASGALGSGVTEDYQLDAYLSRTADLAQLAGISVTEMGGMMNKAYSRGKVDAELMNQLNDRGIPIYKLLQKELGVTAEELQKMSRNGEISFDDLYRATDKYEGLAQAMAMKTLPGAVTVLGQQFGLLGADFLSGAYEPLKEGVIGILNKMKELSSSGLIKQWGQSVGEAIKYFVEWFKTGEASMDNMSPLAQKLVKAFGPVVKIIGTLVKAFIALPAPIKGVAAAFALFGGPLMMVAGGMLKLINMAAGFVRLAQIVGGVGRAFTLLTGFNPIVLAIVAGIAAAVAAGVLLYKNWDKVKAVAAKLAKGVGKAWNAIKNAIGKAVAGVGKVISTYIKVWQKIFTTGWKVIQKVVSVAIGVIRKVIDVGFKAVKTIFTTYIKIWKTIFNVGFKAIGTVVKGVINGIKTVITVGFKAIQTVFTTYVNAWKLVITTGFNAIKLAVTTAVNAVKKVITTAWTAIKSATSKVWNGVKTAITTPINAARKTVSTVVASIKKAFNFSGIASKVKGAFNKVKSAITEPINKAKSLVKTAVDTIKSIFPIKLGKIFSGVKLPHFKISGGKVPWGVGGKGVKPTVKIDWYKKGGIFKQPTLLTSANGIKGVGEAGAEAVLPLDMLWKHMTEMGNNIIKSVQGQNEDITINVYACDGMDIKQLTDEIERRLVEIQKRRRVAWQ